MYLSLFQLFGAAIFLLLVGGMIGYYPQAKKIKSLKNEIRIKDASLKGMWSNQEKKLNKKSISAEQKPNLEEGIDPVHISDSYPSVTR